MIQKIIYVMLLFISLIAMITTVSADPVTGIEHDLSELQFNLIEVTNPDSKDTRQIIEDSFEPGDVKFFNALYDIEPQSITGPNGIMYSDLGILYNGDEAVCSMAYTPDSHSNSIPVYPFAISPDGEMFAYFKEDGTPRTGGIFMRICSSDGELIHQEKVEPYFANPLLPNHPVAIYWSLDNSAILYDLATDVFIDDSYEGYELSYNKVNIDYAGLQAMSNGEPEPPVEETLVENSTESIPDESSDSEDDDTSATASTPGFSALASLVAGIVLVTLHKRDGL